MICCWIWWGTFLWPMFYMVAMFPFCIKVAICNQFSADEYLWVNVRDQKVRLRVYMMSMPILFLACAVSTWALSFSDQYCQFLISDFFVMHFNLEEVYLYNAWPEKSYYLFGLSVFTSDPMVQMKFVDRLIGPILDGPCKESQIVSSYSSYLCPAFPGVRAWLLEVHF